MSAGHLVSSTMCVLAYKEMRGCSTTHLPIPHGPAALHNRPACCAGPTSINMSRGLHRSLLGHRPNKRNSSLGLYNLDKIGLEEEITNLI